MRYDYHQVSVSCDFPGCSETVRVIAEGRLAPITGRGIDEALGFHNWTSNGGDFCKRHSPAESGSRVALIGSPE